MTIDIIHTKVDFQRHLNGCERRLHDLAKNLQTIEKISRNLSVNNTQLYFKQSAEIASDIKFLYSSILQLDQSPYSVTAIKRLSSLKIYLQKTRMKFEAMQQDAHNNLAYDYKQNDIEQLNDEQQEQLAKLINGNANEATLELNGIEKHTTFIGGLEKDIVDIHETFHDIHRIVYEQGRMVSNIEEALTSTDDMIEEATENVKTTVQVKKRSKHIKWILILILICAFLIVILIIFITLKLALPFR
ncbi:unnamed protein product [Rotaria magnacalcarata]|uniref:t-SNARE coiled-coil homology domain-containing protein n=1 Tax=Rotaria magnacalcarata TaxID=392030 RepID=A0A816MQS4_9BILA|nr:unnamed protein product [Rotaria magnacalcarata]CAF1605337.1 unnamed protein product [Rotaria magnacalcarata]CAF1954817.1 unnamed protein product [Rotaria magnacalcarata]CAF2012214.1 unnamed protein product [Rotaria magnacalcarata]CAF2101706.1 unnamed protein product [Rotaria magnacalcarata]